VIRKLSFTGSTAVGKLLLGQASRNVVRTSMELGGDAPFLVLEDADLEIAVDAAFAAKMRNMGEACTAANRFLVHVDVAEEFASRLGERMSALTVGDGLEDCVEVGPLIDQQARNKVQGLVRDALDRGATLVAGGRCPDRPGYFVEPTVLSDVHPDGALDSTRLGTRRLHDHPRPRPALNVSEQLEVGMVGLNTGIVSTPSAPSRHQAVRARRRGRTPRHRGVPRDQVHLHPRPPLVRSTPTTGPSARTGAHTMRGHITYTIDVIAGDGIGLEVMPAAIACVDTLGPSFGFSVDWRHHDWESDHYRRHGRMMPVDGIEQLATGDATLLGAVGAEDIPNDVTLWGC
jgi:Aldehyde dehydrogenase family/Isocitrate/isopropylmalate dehydrogenase